MFKSNADAQVRVATRLVAGAFPGDPDAQSPIQFDSLRAKACTADQLACLELAQQILRGAFQALSPGGASIILDAIHEALAA